jgi:hypothetical protein
MQATWRKCRTGRGDRPGRLGDEGQAGLTCPAGKVPLAVSLQAKPMSELDGILERLDRRSFDHFA